MRRAILLAAAMACIGVVAWAQKDKPADAKQAILDADIAFAKAATEKGIEGFASFIAEDFHTVRPNQNLIGKKEFVDGWAQLLNDPARRISWKPITAVMSKSGDLGYTVGAYEIHKVDDPANPVVSSGKYVSIWKKQVDGSWKVILDTGVQDQPPPKK